MMKNFVLKISLILVIFLPLSMMAQSITLNFTGIDVNNNRVQLDRVSVTNLTKDWQEMLIWPDTILTMQNALDINNNNKTILLQNTPNPFNGNTDVLLQVADKAEVIIEIVNMDGRTVVSGKYYIPTGIHLFRITLTSIGTYVMNACQNGNMTSIKIVNNGAGNENKIEHIENIPIPRTRGNTNNPFTLGDQMEYVGYATINGLEYESEHIIQTQTESQTFVLQFNVEQIVVPTVTTTSVNDITASTVTGYGYVSSDGGSVVTERGMCWSVLPNPTIADSYASYGSGTGYFTVGITGLSASTTYYIRAYAINSVGVAYGNDVTFTTSNPHVPIVAVHRMTSITPTTATCGGNVSSDGGETVTARGVCWSTSPTPTISNEHTTDGSGMGIFSSSLTNLAPGTNYYLRAYATNSLGTGYSLETQFSTPGEYDGQPCPVTATVTDIDGNTYNTVMIGSQCWMKENLRVTRYADATPVSQGSSSFWGTYGIPYWYYPNGDSSIISSYGLLYNWSAAMRNSSFSSSNPSGVQGICPTGWHLPSMTEWSQLNTYVGSQSQYVCGDDNRYIAKALSATSGWSTAWGNCVVGNSPLDNDATGFSALPAGLYNADLYLYEYGYGGYGNSTSYWSTSGSDNENGMAAGISASSSTLHINNSSSDKLNGYSVRCLRD